MRSTLTPTAAAKRQDPVLSIHGYGVCLCVQNIRLFTREMPAPGIGLTRAA
jgi:hypothetical protein